MDTIQPALLVTTATPKYKRILAWIAVGISAIFANFWAYWGINENFHEGWYFEKFWSNVLLMFGQYLLMPIAFILLALVAIRWNRVGAILHLLLAVGAYVLFGKMKAGFLFVAIPLLGLALFYWFGKIERIRLAYLLVACLPLLQIVGIGAYHAVRVSSRFDDGDLSARTIQGKGLALTWAPEGPGWPDNGTSWDEARSICARLSEDGKSVGDQEINIWRLPTIDEAVRSSVYHGTNAGGVWDSVTHTASYAHQPDKESPLWNMHRKTIYWWTATDANGKEAYIIVYNGGVWPRMKSLRAGYLNFRAVKNVLP